MTPEERELAERHYLAFCHEFNLDPDDQQSAIAFEVWWQNFDEFWREHEEGEQ